MSKLLPNLPIEDLTSENDYIGIIEKGTLLKTFFLTNKHEFSRIKIFSIYGEWGSGKSTLMKYLEKELKSSFNTFFFESWEYESDENLSLSLLENLVNKDKSKYKKVKEELLETGGKLLEGFARSVTIKTPGLNISGDKLIKTIKEEKEPTFLELKDKFKKDFINWENKMTTGIKTPNYNIVFIDDLDRCEPENILNLLSAMKLFFTYGKKTIFLCGIDKKAIREAVKTKYGEIVKANEYLEKIFDISFSMPENVDTSKLIFQYFDDDEKVGEKKLGDLISNFFKELQFRNPRRIKKILNKYLIIKRLKESEVSENLILPNIISGNCGTLFETYLTLYMLMLNEFEPEKFKMLFNLSAKKVNYTESLSRSTSTGLKNSASIFQYFIENSLSTSFNNFQMNERGTFLIYISNFVPLNVDSLEPSAFMDKNSFLKNFDIKNKALEYYFTLFLYSNENLFMNGIKKLEITLLDYKRIISNLI
tara:strand:+ start:180 stop:1616 length:1437 start_codon:yes stop_codon:yes gene_type:complete